MQKFTYEKGKLNRSHLKHYADTTFGGTDSPKWAILGKNVDDASVALNPTVESTKNILDETDVNDNGYEPSLEIGTYYANPSDAIYVQLKKIALERLTGEECRTKILEVLIDKTDSPFDAWTEEVYIKPQSYCGSQSGVNIPYTITFAGNRTKGTVAFTSGVPTFTEAE